MSTELNWLADQRGLVSKGEENVEWEEVENDCGLQLRVTTIIPSRR